ncbi:MAG: hypothetical protein KC708_02265 [Anaerolineae bacterium]|nr:hypothetical protein [Anaerolineae bacterium]
MDLARLVSISPQKKVQGLMLIVIFVLIVIGIVTVAAFLVTAHWRFVLQTGRMEFQGVAAGLLDDIALLRAYLGG